MVEDLGTVCAELAGLSPEGSGDIGRGLKGLDAVGWLDPGRETASGCTLEPRKGSEVAPATGRAKI